MIRDICKDETFLAQKAEPATAEDQSVAADLLETLEHHKEGCVGMAANMIGVNKRIIAFDNEGTYMVMFNPEIVKKSGPYDAVEGCLSLTGTRPCQAVELHQSALAKREVPGTAENLHRLDRSNHPTRNRPL